MKTNKRLNQVVAGVVSTSLIAPSCTPYFTDGDIYEEAVIDDAALGDIAIPISLKLKPDDAKYILALQNLALDIIDNQDIAREFSNNPTLILKKYGYDGNVNLDDNLSKFVLALGDEEINNAIKAKDIKGFLSLCKEKDLLTQEYDLFSDDYYQNQLSFIKKKLGRNHPPFSIKNGNKARLKRSSVNASLVEQIDEPVIQELIVVAGLLAVVVVIAGAVASLGAAITVYALYRTSVRVTSVQADPSYYKELLKNQTYCRFLC